MQGTIIVDLSDPFTVYGLFALGMAAQAIADAIDDKLCGNPSWIDWLDDGSDI